MPKCIKVGWGAKGHREAVRHISQNRIRMQLKAPTQRCVLKETFRQKIFFFLTVVTIDLQVYKYIFDVKTGHYYTID